MGMQNETPDLKIVYLSPDELTPYEHNTRKHAPDDIEQIKQSILEDNFNDPIAVWGPNNIIVEGHGRQIAAKELGLERVPCIRLDHLTDTQRREYAIRHNRTAELSAWDFGKLEQEIAALKIDGVDLSGLDFDIPDILGGATEPTANDDDFDPNAEVETRAKRGDIWQLGRHRLMCGDSTDYSDVARLMDGENADTYLIDPPYEKEDLYSVIPENNGGRLFVFSDHKHYQRAIVEATEKRWNARFEFVWDCCQSWYTPNRPLARHKTCFVFGNSKRWEFDRAIIHDGKNREEKDVVNTRGGYHYVPLDGAVHMRTVEAFPNTMQNDENGYGKPIAWIAAMLNGYGGDVVADLFGGSGAGLIACEQTNRMCYTMEIDPHYCDIIIDRWKNLTGENAVLVNN